MKIIFLPVLLAFSLSGYSQVKDTAAKNRIENTEVKITADTTNTDAYFIITISPAALKVRHQGRVLAINSIDQLNEYLKKNTGKINRGKIAVEYPLNTSFQTVEPLFDALKKNGIYRWRLMVLR